MSVATQSPVSFVIAQKPSSPPRRSLLIPPTPLSLSLSSSAASVSSPPSSPIPPFSPTAPVSPVDAVASPPRDLTSQLAVCDFTETSLPNDTASPSLPLEDELAAATVSSAVEAPIILPDPALTQKFALPLCDVCARPKSTTYFRGVYCDGCIVRYYNELLRQDYMNWDRVQFGLLPLSSYTATVDNAVFKARVAEYKQSCCDEPMPTYSREQKQVFVRSAKRFSSLMLMHYGTGKYCYNAGLAGNLLSVPLYASLSTRQWLAWSRLVDRL